MKRILVILCLATLAAVVLFGVVPPPRAEAVTFTKHELTPGAEVYALALADFNGDGKQDLAATRSGGIVSILLGNGDGTFAAEADIVTGHNSWSAAAADFNDDAKFDLVTAHWGDADGCVSILLGNGDGSFATHTDFGVVYPSSVAVGDFNGDGKQDLAIATAGPLGGVSILLGNGDGSFAAKTDFGTSATSVTVGDFNGDGKQDLAATNGSTLGIVSILLGNGDGSFAAHADCGVGAYPGSLTVADFNRDGKQDLVTANAGGANSVSVLLGNGDGSFAAKTDFAIGASTRSVTAGDFNGDGKQDLAATNRDARANRVSVLLGNGLGGFAGKTDCAATGDAQMGSGSVTAADFNGDGKPDLATANGSASGNGSVSVLLNTTKPKIASLKPARGKVGVTMTIVGSSAGWNFGETRGTSKVYFGTKAVTKYVSWSKYQIKVRVPSLPKGKKAVTVKTPAGKSNVKYFTVL